MPSTAPGHASSTDPHPDPQRKPAAHTEITGPHREPLPTGLLHRETRPSHQPNITPVNTEDRGTNLLTSRGLIRNSISEPIQETTLAREHCHPENWRNPQGVASLAQASKALSRLADKLDLPATRPMPPPGTPGAMVKRDCSEHTLAFRIKGPGGVTLEPVEDAGKPLFW